MRARVRDLHGAASRANRRRMASEMGEGGRTLSDVSFSCVVKSQRRWSNKIYKTKLTKIRYNNQVLCKYRVDPMRAGLSLII